jgi:hypothetical protein
MLSSQMPETVLILKKVSQKFLILLDRSTQLDGMFGLSNLDGKKELDLSQSIIGLISRVLEIIIMQSLASRSLDQILKDLD